MKIILLFMLMFQTYLFSGPAIRVTSETGDLYITLVLTQDGTERYRDEIRRNVMALSRRGVARYSPLISILFSGIEALDKIPKRYIGLGYCGLAEAGSSVRGYSFLIFKFSSKVEGTPETVEMAALDFLDIGVYLDSDGLEIVKRIVIDNALPSVLENLRLRI